MVAWASWRFEIINSLIYNNQILMQQQTTYKPKFHEDVKLNSPISLITSCNKYLAVLCEDQSFRIWQNEDNKVAKKLLFHNVDEPSVSSLCFNHNSSSIATCSLDSTIKIWDLDTIRQPSKTFPDQSISVSRIALVGLNLFSCGDVGRAQFYDLFQEKYKKVDNLGDTFLNAIAVAEDQTSIAVGNANGDVFIINMSTKAKVCTLKPHYKIIRSIKFSQDKTKLLTGSDDTCIAKSDLQQQKVTQIFEGHYQKVTGLANHPQNDHIFYSCSYDSTIKTWDLRRGSSISQFKTNNRLQSIQIVKGHLLAGGQSGILQIFKI